MADATVSASPSQTESELDVLVGEAMFAVGNLNKAMQAAGVSRAERRAILRSVAAPDVESVYVPNPKAARDAIRFAQRELEKARLEV